MWLGSGHLLQQVDISAISVLSSAVKVVQSARDLGVMLDSPLLLTDHIADALHQAGFYQLRQIRLAIWSPTSAAAKTINNPGIYRVSSGLHGATGCCTACPRIYPGRCSLNRTLPHVYSPAYTTPSPYVTPVLRQLH